MPRTYRNYCREEWPRVEPTTKRPGDLLLCGHGVVLAGQASRAPLTKETHNDH